MAKKYYAVAMGKTPGIYLTWEDCKAQVHGFPRAVYKSFSTFEEAEEFIVTKGRAVQDAAPDDSGMYGNSDASLSASDAGVQTTCSTVCCEVVNSQPVSSDTHLIAYVDGSYDHSQLRYAYGCALVLPDEVITLNGSGAEEDYVSMRNVAGEILGSEQAVVWALEHGYREITIYYDYEGIEKWADGIWKANKPGTRRYKAFIAEKRKSIVIAFQKVAAHTGIKYNEMADRLAKEALGLAT